MLTKILRNGMIGTLVALLPVTSSLAATRPNEAVPMAASVSSSAALADDGDHSVSWLAIGLGVLAVAIFAVLVLGNGDDDDEAVSGG